MERLGKKEAKSEIKLKNKLTVLAEEKEPITEIREDAAVVIAEKLDEQILGPTGTNGPDDSGLSEVRIDLVTSVPIDTRLKWRKVGGGSLRFNGLIIKPGQEFLANIEEIPKVFLDALVCLDEVKVQAERIKATTTPDVKFKLKLTNGGLYDVVNEHGKPINEKPMVEEKAIELKKALES